MTFGMWATAVLVSGVMGVLLVITILSGVMAIRAYRADFEGLTLFQRILQGGAIVVLSVLTVGVTALVLVVAYGLLSLAG